LLLAGCRGESGLSARPAEWRRRATWRNCPPKAPALAESLELGGHAVSEPPEICSKSLSNLSKFQRSAKSWVLSAGQLRHVALRATLLVVRQPLSPRHPASSKSRATFRRPSRCFWTIVPNRKQIRRGSHSRRIKPRSKNLCHIRRKRTPRAGPKFRDKVQIEVQQTAQGIEVRTQYPEDTRNCSAAKTLPILLIMTLPFLPMPILVKNSFGNVNVSGVRSKSEFDNSHGSLNVRDTGSLASPFVWKHRAEWRIRDASGDRQQRLRTSLAGERRARSTQSIRQYHRARYWQARPITGGNGAVTVMEVGSASITTSFGSVEARNIHGDLMVHDNTAISMYRTLAAPLILLTASETSRFPRSRAG